LANVTFGGDAARRISKQVKRSERTPHGGSVPTQFVGFPTALGRWARITGGGGGVIKYSWIAVELQSDGSWADKADWGEGDHTADTGYAVEAPWRGKNVIHDDIVWLMPGLSANFYVFLYPRANVICEGSATAASGGTFGTGTATVGAQSIPIVNISHVAVTSEFPLLASYHQGDWIVTVEPCEEE
jgi:hypothetical protein